MWPTYSQSSFEGESFVFYGRTHLVSGNTRFTTRSLHTITSVGPDLCVRQLSLLGFDHRKGANIFLHLT